MQGLVAGVKDGQDSVEYKAVVSQLIGKLQQHGVGGIRANTVAGSLSTAAAAAAAAPPAHMPQFVAARQRRLQTNVGLALCQQPEATAREAAEVAALPGFLPWKQAPTAQFGKRMAYEKKGEFNGGGGGTFAFADGDPRAAEVRRWLAVRLWRERS